MGRSADDADPLAVPMPPAGGRIPRSDRRLIVVSASELVRIVADYRRLTAIDPPYVWLDNADQAAIFVEHAPAIWMDRVWEAETSGGAARVFFEQAPNLWVPLGRTARTTDAHLIRQKPVLLDESGQRLEIDSPPHIGEFLTVAAKTEPKSRSHSPGRLRITPRLTHREAESKASLWIFHDDALAKLSRLCRSSHEQTLGLLEVAVVTADGRPAALIRMGKASRIPPVILEGAVAYSLWQTRSHLFLPDRTRLAPAVRRDVWLKAMSLAPGRVGWLNPRGEQWRLESVAEDAFKALSQWVEYRPPVTILERTAWEQSGDWEIGGFDERHEAKKEKRPEADPRLQRRKTDEEQRKGLLARAMGWLKKPAKAADVENRESPRPVSLDDAVKTALRQSDRLHHARPESMGGAAERVQQLETAFLRKLEKPDTEPPGAWSELAAAYDAVEKPADAALCWLNALWTDRSAPALWTWGWLRSAARESHLDARLADPAAWLEATPAPPRTRALAAWVVWASRQSPVPAGLPRRAVELQNHLRAHEHWLPVRSAWLAQTALATFNRGDVLGLARTRDRLAQRLLETGLSLELDTPSFLRFGDDQSRMRHHEASRWLEEKRRPIQRWIATQTSRPTLQDTASAPSAILLETGLEPERSNTLRYADLLIGWGLTRLSESLRAEEIIKQADEGFPVDNPVHALIRSAFEHRLRNIREGRPARASLPPEWHEQRERLPGMERYFADKFCEHSRVLQPNPPPSAYLESVFQKALQTGPMAFTLNRLNSAKLNDLLPDILQKEVRDRGPTPELARLAANALRRVTELRPETLEALLAVMPTALDASRTSPVEWSALIEHGLAAASFADRPDVAKLLVKELLSPASTPSGLELPETMTSQAFRSLRRMGLRAEADRVLHHLAGNLTQGVTYAKIRKTRGLEWPGLLRTMLHVAAGWYYAGRDDQAFAVLEEAKADLFDPETSAVNRTRLALAYVQTLGQAPLRVTLGRLDELFQRLSGLHLRGSSNRYFCLPMIQLTEAGVRAVVADDLAGGAVVRSWLDADEFSVRRRIRDELGDLMKAQGLNPVSATYG